MRKARPICGDQFAERFMDAEARALFKRFKKFRGPNASNAARHRIIDDWLRHRLSDQPKLRIVLLGAGFDTRAFRLIAISLRLLQRGRVLEACKIRVILL